jgi:hypothetical protein
MELVPSEEREITSQAVADRWRGDVGTVPGAEELIYTGAIFRAGAPISVRLSGAPLDTLRQIGEQIKVRLRDYPGVFDIADSYRAGKGRSSSTSRRAPKPRA